MTYYNPTEEEVGSAYKYFAKSILEHFNGKPDLIIGLKRGGLIPAVYLSHLLKVPLKVADYSHHQSVGDDKDSHEFIIPEISNNIKKIVVVDDIIDTGYVICGFLRSLQIHNDCEIIVVTLYHKHGSVFNHNKYKLYSWRNIPSNSPFVNFPWEGEYKL